MICPICKAQGIEELISAVMMFIVCLECGIVFDYYEIKDKN